MLWNFMLVIPVCYLVAQEWLNKFAYHVSVEPVLFAKGAFIILLVAIITVSFQSIKPALSNPAHILKNE